jgi:hypothetical protein
VHKIHPKDPYSKPDEFIQKCNILFSLKLILKLSSLYLTIQMLYGVSPVNQVILDKGLGK